ncbi:DUF6126 family protein [Streptomyces sp. KLMMK]|uniref:DUF6126 family protein n=1 Tax=Streptomyces telluris TaxID=2720021 RepID=A0A9X2LCB7_9ACTN|nr:MULTISPECIES: DUF6126 family protein [Streptomyces]MCQ8768431.1 DUF6126 family protein [Streptomyces telluris]
MSEKRAERQVAFRVLIYVFVTHLFAGFIWLLFYLGGHADK